jgi:hypothetical protein
MFPQHKISFKTQNEKNINFICCYATASCGHPKCKNVCARTILDRAGLKKICFWPP